MFLRWNCMCEIKVLACLLCDDGLSKDWLSTPSIPKIKRERQLLYVHQPIVLKGDLIFITKCAQNCPDLWRNACRSIFHKQTFKWGYEKNDFCFALDVRYVDHLLIVNEMASSIPIFFTRLLKRIHHKKSRKNIAKHFLIGGVDRFWGGENISWLSESTDFSRVENHIDDPTVVVNGVRHCIVHGEAEEETRGHCQ